MTHAMITSFRGLTRKMKRSYPDPLTYAPQYVISINESQLSDYVDCIYPIELEINVTTETAWSVSCLDLHLEFDGEGRLKRKCSAKEMISIFLL